jgi:hypothetical protein
MKGAGIVRPGRAMLNQRRSLGSIRRPRRCHPPAQAGSFNHPTQSYGYAVSTDSKQFLLGGATGRKLLRKVAERVDP